MRIRLLLALFAVLVLLGLGLVYLVIRHPEIADLRLPVEWWDTEEVEVTDYAPPRRRRMRSWSMMSSPRRTRRSSQT